MSILRSLFAISAIACLCACSSPYTKVEHARILIKERTFTHIYDDGLSVSIVCREKAGTATVAARIENGTSETIKVRNYVALFIEGRKAIEHSDPSKSHTIPPGQSLELACDYTFVHSFERNEETIYPGQQLVSVQLDTYDSPLIYLDLSADNYSPFRFASFP